MAKTTTVQKIRDKWAGLCGLDKDTVNTDDASVFLSFLNLAIDEAWLSTEWPFAMRITAHQTDSNLFVDLSSDTGISEVLRVYDANPLSIGVGAFTRYNDITTVENADVDGLYVPDAAVAVAVAFSTLTSSGTTATFTSATDHGLTTGNSAIIAGADQSDYNGTFIVTVTSTTVFTYTMLADPAVDTATGTITSTLATVFLEHRIVTPEYTLVTDTVPRRLENYLAYRTSASWYQGEAQFAKANELRKESQFALLNEIERLERQQNQQLPTNVGVRVSGRK